MTNKLKYFIGNWKMFGDFSDFKIINQINNFASKSKKTFKSKKIIMCVPSTVINYYKTKLKSKSISLGVQNCHYHQGYGPFTGSLSSRMLKNSGAEFIILGHSENRSEGESNKLISKKIFSSLRQGLNIIFCVGETKIEKRRKKTFQILKKQIKQSIEKNFKINKIIIAYEPVWSIGTNKIPKMEELKRNIKFIKDIFLKTYKVKNIPKILYGGSVNSKNIGFFSKISEIDGFLIGGSSQSPKKFIDIIKNYYK